MAVVERKDKQGPVFYAVNNWNGRQVSERVGRNRREAERRDAAMKKEIKAGTYVPPTKRRVLSFGDWATLWHAKRTNTWADGERAYTKNHFESRAWFWKKPITEIRPEGDIDRLIAEMRSLTKPDGSRRLSDKTISDIIGQLKRMFTSAIRAEVCDRNPVVLEPGTLKRKTKEREPYTAAEVAVLIRHHKIPWPTRVLIALWVLAGLRQGEGCGLRWKRLDLHANPLASLDIVEQWEGEKLKTERPRRVPVHPLLLAILKEWAETGFELYVGRKPLPDDFIVPEATTAGPMCADPSKTYRQFIQACEATGIRPRTLHSCRHTFITLARRGGARADVLERVTHNAVGTMIDRYTHFDWAPLCEAVLCLRLESLPNLPPPNGSDAETRALESGKETNSAENTAVCADTSEVVCRPELPPLKPNKAAESRSRKTIQAAVQAETSGKVGFRESLRLANEERQRKLLTLAEVDPTGARPGLAFTRAYAATLKGDGPSTLAALEEAAQALGLGVRRG